MILREKINSERSLDLLFYFPEYYNKNGTLEFIYWETSHHTPRKQSICLQAVIWPFAHLYAWRALYSTVLAFSKLDNLIPNSLSLWSFYTIEGHIMGYLVSIMPDPSIFKDTCYLFLFRLHVSSSFNFFSDGMPSRFLVILSKAVDNPTLVKNCTSCYRASTECQLVCEEWTQILINLIIQGSKLTWPWLNYWCNSHMSSQICFCIHSRFGLI